MGGGQNGKTRCCWRGFVASGERCPCAYEIKGATEKASCELKDLAVKQKDLNPDIQLPKQNILSRLFYFLCK